MVFVNKLKIMPLRQKKVACDAALQKALVKINLIRSNQLILDIGKAHGRSAEGIVIFV
jgi:hypothetical protein